MTLLLCDRCGIKIEDDRERINARRYPRAPEEEEDADQVVSFCSWDCARLYALDRANKEVKK